MISRRGLLQKVASLAPVAAAGAVLGRVGTPLLAATYPAIVGDIDGETVYEAGLISLGQNAERFISWTAL